MLATWPDPLHDSKYSRRINWIALKIEMIIEDSGDLLMSLCWNEFYGIHPQIKGQCVGLCSTLELAVSAKNTGQTNNVDCLNLCLWLLWEEEWQYVKLFTESLICARHDASLFSVTSSRFIFIATSNVRCGNKSTRCFKWLLITQLESSKLGVLQNKKIWRRANNLTLIWNFYKRIDWF